MSTETYLCPYCNQEIAKAALVCKHCGKLLQKIEGDSLKTLVISRPDGMFDDLDDTQFPQGTSRFIPNSPLYISIERQNTPLSREVGDEPVVLGRIDAGKPSELGELDVDLSPYNALARGVSRRHAQIFIHEDELVIEDLNSSNGTTVNGEALEPGNPVTLRDGDEIMLGRMMLWINF